MYLLSCVTLDFFVIIDRAVYAFVHGKDVVHGMNAIDKCMLKLAMEKILNHELICD